MAFPSISTNPSVQYGPHNSVTSTPRHQQPPFDLNAAVLAFLTSQAQAQAGRNQLQTEQHFGRHLGIGGTPIDPKTGVEAGDPFANGFFKSGAERSAREADVLSGAPQHMVNIPPPQVTNPNTPGIGFQPPGPSITPGNTDPMAIAAAIRANQQMLLPGAMGTASTTGRPSAPMRPRTGASFGF